MEIDSYTTSHLDAWLDAQIDGDTRREIVRKVMLAVVAEDPEYWGSQSWWNVYDRAKCDQLLNYDIQEDKPHE